MAVVFKSKGDFSKANSFLEKMKESVNLGILNKYGREGVKALASATPKDSGATADSWSYTIEHGKGYAKLIFNNDNIVDDVKVAVVLQYGHATKNGGWVEGIDYINPALKPLFEKIADESWKEVISR